MKIHPLKSEGKIVYNEILKEDKKIDYEELICIGLGKHRYNFTIFLNLKTFGDSIYEVNLSLRAAKLKQRNMENLIARLDCYAPTNKEYVAQRKSIFDNAREFYKGRKMILFAFENGLFPLPKQYPSENKGDWKEGDMDPSHIIFEKTDKLLLSFKRIRKILKKQCLINMIEYKNLNQKSLIN